MCASSPTRTQYMSDTSIFQHTCEECRRRGVTCGGVWRFHSQHSKYLMQCRVCRLKRRACPFRKFESNGQLLTNTSRQKDAAKGKKRQRSPSIISISDSEDHGESQVAGPSSRPEKRVKVEGGDENEDDEDVWKSLLDARKRKVEIETNAEKAAMDTERSKKEVAAKIHGLEQKLKRRK